MKMRNAVGIGNSLLDALEELQDLLGLLGLVALIVLPEDLVCSRIDNDRLHGR